MRLFRTPPQFFAVRGWGFQSSLMSTRHIRQLVGATARELGHTCPTSHLLKGPSIALWPQMCNLMESSPLIWSTCSTSHHNLLDKVQRNAEAIGYPRNSFHRISLTNDCHIAFIGNLCMMCKESNTIHSMLPS